MLLRNFSSFPLEMYCMVKHIAIENRSMLFSSTDGQTHKSALRALKS